jgi:putative tryptophan/tyrosine transport system substrate-binding protein
MRRREFIKLLGSAATWPIVARAQQSDPVRRIGVLLRVIKGDPDTERDLQALRKGLRDLGWTVGKNVQIDYRYASADPAQMREYAAELVRVPEEVIVAHGSLALNALRLETDTLPVVFVRVADALGQGFVASLAHPGGNVTGFTSFEHEMIGKWLGLLKDVAPGLVQVVLMFNPETAPYGPGFLRSFETTAPSFAVKAIGVLVHDRAEIKGAMTTLGRDERVGLIVLPYALTDVYREEIVALAAQNRVPTVYGYRYFATAGGLISYGADSGDMYRRAASYVDRILNGANPADLPVQQPVRFELVINLKTANALGLTVPLYLQQVADEVIE